MERTIPICFWISISCTSLCAQTVSSLELFPGQKISYVTYTESGRLDLDIEGEDVTWDFSYLQAPYQKEVSIEPAINGQRSRDFPDADLVLKEVNGYERYLQQSGNNLIEIGRTGGYWFLEDVDQLIKYEVKPIIRKSGMNYGQSYSDRSSFTIDLSRADLARLRSTNIPAAFDSLRYEVSVINEISADGVGQLILPLSFYEVIRLRHEIEMTITPYIKSKLGWRNYNENNDPDLLPIIPTGIFHFSRYEYWSETASMAVMSVDVIGDSFTARYVASDPSIPKVKVYNQSKDVLAFPNPTYGEIEIQLINLPPGRYTLEIDNIFGQSLHKEEFNVNHTRKMKTDLSFLSRGTYLYSIIDSRGNKIATKRVVIITP